MVAWVCDANLHRLVFGCVGSCSECHVEPVASIVLRYWVVPAGSEQESVGFYMYFFGNYVEQVIFCLTTFLPSRSRIAPILQLNCDSHCIGLHVAVD